MSNTWFSSDLHFGHRNALLGWGNEQAARPFGSLEEMTEGLIERHNALVKKGDKVYWIGDVFWRTFGVDEACKAVDRMNGQKYYILGNHEELMDKSERLRSKF